MAMIEEMVKVLKANGYKFLAEQGLWDSYLIIDYKDGYTLFIQNPSGNMQIEGNSYEDTIEIAYAHYLQQQRSAKMEALLENVVNYWNVSVDQHNIESADSIQGILTEFVKIVEGAKEILAEKETG